MSETMLIINAETGEELVRDLTNDEIAEREASQTEAENMAAEAQAKADARTSALAKLAELGLTEEEVAAL
jgi:hypothetical protein